MLSPFGDTSGLPHDNHQANIIACAVLTWAIALVLVALRFYARGVIINTLGPSDWCILLSLVFSGAVSVSAIDQVSHGKGKHVWDADPNEFTAMTRAGWYGILFYSLTLFFTKLAILLLFLVIFMYDWVRIAIKVILAITVVSSVFIVAVVCTACIPLQAFWDFTLAPSAYCHPQSFYWANTGLHIITDFLIYLLPLPVVYSLRMPRRQKNILLGIFALGFFAVFTSILRLINLVQTQTSPSPDFTYSGIFLTYWTTVEVNALIVVACLMTLKPLMARLFPNVFTDSYQQRSSSNAPPTIGSMPMRSPNPWDNHERLGSWPRYPGRVNGVDANSVGFQDERRNEYDTAAHELEAQSSIDFEKTSPSDFPAPPSNARLRPPPNIHGFLDSASEQSGGRSAPPSSNRVMSPAFYDSMSSSDPDIGPPVRQNSAFWPFNA